MSRAIAAVTFGVLSSTSLTLVLSQTTTETSSATTTTESSTITSTDTTSSQTSTTVPGPFFVTQSILLLSNGTQEEVEILILSALDFVFAETARTLDADFVPRGPQVQCVEDVQCPAGSICSVDSGVCLPRYELLTSDRCSIHVRTMHECSAAAASLGLGDTSAVPDGQTGISYDPPFCYFESGSLKYNQGGSNTGGCNYRDHCVCATSSRELLYDNLTAVTTGVELRSSGGADIAGRLGDTRGQLPDSFNVLSLLESDAAHAFYEIGAQLGFGHLFHRLSSCPQCIRRLTSDAPGALWRVDAEVIAYDRYTSEQLFYALGNLQNPMTAEYASFFDAVQAQVENSSLLVADLLLSDPDVKRPTETMTETHTTTTTATTRTTVTATATTAADQAVPPPIEDSAMPLIVAVAGGAAVLLAGGSAAAALVSKRRKAVNVGNDVQHTIDWNMERGTASHNSKYSSNVIEI